MSTVLAERMVALRKKMGLNKAQMGEVLGLKGSGGIGKYESGECAPTGKRWAKFQELEKQYLNGATEHQPELVQQPLKQEPQSKPVIQRPKMVQRPMIKESAVFWKITELFDALSEEGKEKVRRYVQCNG